MSTNLPKIKRVHIFGGGTVAHITNHFAVCAPAYGRTAEKLFGLCQDRFGETSKIVLELTRMAGGPVNDWDVKMETNADVARRIDQLKAEPNTKVIFMSVALCDWNPTNALCVDHQTDNSPPKKTLLGSAYENHDGEIGKHTLRLNTHNAAYTQLWLKPAAKVISSIRTGRKDIFLVGFKATCGASRQEMFEKGLRLCKEGSCNLVLVNDTKTHWNMIVTPEEAAYHEGTDRDEVLRQLVDMAWFRSQLTFTQSTVVDGRPVAWNDSRVPDSLRTVVNHCIKGNAYKPFNGATVGHFAVRLSETEFLTSIRKSDFNRLDETGLVYVKTDGPDTVLAYGAKPSVGGQSQRIVFRDHPGFDCIAHFHCPLRPDHPDDIPVKSQREVECGSHQCGRQTSEGLKQFGNLKAVYLDQHGPNIVFPASIDPAEVIAFIERNFDLSQKTGGYTV